MISLPQMGFLQSAMLWGYVLGQVNLLFRIPLLSLFLWADSI